MIKQYKAFVMLILLILLGACSGGETTDNTVIISVALTQTAAAISADNTISEATPLPPAPVTQEVGTISEATPPPPAPATQEVDTVSFSLADANVLPPADVLAAVPLFIGHGGPRFAECDEVEQEVTAPQQIAWVEISRVVVCGLYPQGLTAELIAPNGDTRFLETNIVTPMGESGSNALDINILMPPGSLEGEYTLLLNSPDLKAGTVERKINVVKPVNGIPETFTVLGKDKEIQEIYLYNFTPHETVRLFSYKDDQTQPDASFVAWQAYQVTIDGYLIIQPTDPNTKYRFGAFGDLSGEANSTRYLSDFATLFPTFQQGTSIMRPADNAPISQPTSTPADDTKINLLIRNESPVDICDILIGASAGQGFENDLLGEDTLLPGAAIEFSVYPNEYELATVDCNGKDRSSGSNLLMQFDFEWVIE